MPSLLSPQLKRLLSYVRPYAFRLSFGVVLVVFVALAEGMVAFMIKIAFDYVLKPSVFVTKPVLFTLPGNHVVYLSDFLPSTSWASLTTLPRPCRRPRAQCRFW